MLQRGATAGQELSYSFNSFQVDVRPLHSKTLNFAVGKLQAFVFDLFWLDRLEATKGLVELGFHLRHTLLLPKVGIIYEILE